MIDEMLSANETMQCNTSCYVDDSSPDLILPADFYDSKIIQDTDFLSTDFDSQGNILLERILKKLSMENKNIKTHNEDMVEHLIPIKIAISGTDRMYLDLIDYASSSSPQSFYYLDDFSHDYPVLSRSEMNTKEEDYYLANYEYRNPPVVSNCAEVHDIQYESSVRMTVTVIKNYVIVYQNLSICACVLMSQLPQQKYDVCVSIAPLDTYLYPGCDNIRGYANGIYGTALQTLNFDKCTLSSKLRLKHEKSLTIIQNFLSFITTFPIKCSGFDFYSRTDLHLAKADVQLDSIADLCATGLYKINCRGDNISIYNEINSRKNRFSAKESTKTHFKRRKRSETALPKKHVRLGSSLSKGSQMSTDTNATTSKSGRDTSSKKLIAVNGHPSNFRKPHYTVSNENFHKATKTKENSSRFIDKQSIGSLKNHFRHSSVTRKSKLAEIIDMKSLGLEKNRITIKKKNHESLKYLLSTIISEEIIFEIQPIIDRETDKLARSVALEIWNVKILSSKRGIKPLTYLRKPSKLYSSLSLRMNLRKMMTKSIKELHNARDTISPQAVISDDPPPNIDAIHTIPLKKINKLSGLSIYDMITAQTMFGQPPKSCIKSKHGSHKRFGTIRNLSWNLLQPDSSRISTSNSKQRIHKRRSTNSNEPSSIFDFAKSRCQSTELVPRISLTNEELIRALKRSLTNTGALKTLNRDSLSSIRPQSRGNLDRQIGCNSLFKNYIFRRRLASRQSYRNMSIPIINHHKYLNNNLFKQSKRVSIGRHNPDEKWNSKSNLNRITNDNSKNLNFNVKNSIWI